MKKELILIIVLSLTGIWAASAKGKDYKIYDVPEEVRRTGMFALEVSDDSLTWRQVPVIMALSATGNSPFITLDGYGAPVVTIREDDTHVILEEGAHVCAALDIRGASGVRISGYGIYGVRFNNVTFDGKPHTQIGTTTIGNVNP